MIEKKKLLIQKRKRLLDEIQSRGDFIKANVRQITKRGTLIEAYHLTYKDENQKTHSKYVPQAKIKQIEKSIANMKKVRQLINEISKINVGIMTMD